ncbi:MAG: aminoacyl-histidine dipeptidase [Bacteroidia bacterium]|nr:aminoacyl-histidine dipeptidase [Bacteroidia bacterium]
MSAFSELKPELVWTYFKEICSIPRLSKNEAKIREYLLRFAHKNDLESKEDPAGNILIIRPSSHGMEKHKTVVLQSHMDMVGEKNADHPHDWTKDPIVPIIKEGWVTASGTTLGADDGMGIAAQMAILTDKNIKTGKIECLFTVDEESGMTGAINLSPGFFEGRILLNLDSEDEGILYIGCAGGMDTVGEMKYQPIAPDRDTAAIEISVTGLRGGHSGDEIHKGFGNSVKIMNRILWNLANEYKISLSNFDGGNLRNAIPREAFATIVIEELSKSSIEKWIADFNDLMLDELGHIEKDLKISVKDAEMPHIVMDKDNQNRLLSSLTCCPHGPIAWSKEMDDLVETSTNLASVKFVGDDTIRIVTTQRSSIDSSKRDVAAMVESCLKLAGAEVEHSSGYPGWRPNLSSEILKITRQSYRKLFGKDPKVRAIHAGLECGLIFEKFKGIDMISFGPTIRGAHTPEEKIEICTAQMFWDLLLDVLDNIPLN